jgi:hypothetical protein
VNRLSIANGEEDEEKCMIARLDPMSLPSVW